MKKFDLRYNSLLEKASDKDKFDRVKYYEEYYKNLVPKGFIVTSKDNEIIIKINNK